jgi:predicted ATPase
MLPGDEIVGRFVIEEVAVSGHHSVLFRARDRSTGLTVALKVMGGAAGADFMRFSREARILAEMRHPNIVRYIAHGMTVQGDPYLAMEWLDGETLDARIERGPMALNDAVLVAGQVAAALAELHQRGIVHRDVKPANLFLVGSDVSRVKVLDLGIAHTPNVGRTPTRVGVILGTPGYMAPEQVRGAREIDPRADVFSLGCVFFECLTARPAIEAESVEALLGRTLLEDCARVREFRQDVPAGLDYLIARMVARDPADRPESALALLAELSGFAPPEIFTQVEGTLARAALDALAAVASDERYTIPTAPPTRDTESSAPTVPSGPPSTTVDDAAPTEPPRAIHGAVALSDAERRLLSVVLVAVDHEATADANATTLRRTAESFGAQFEVLWGGVTMTVLRVSGAATDQAARAARCALTMRALAPTAVIALATGWGEVAGHGAVGEVIDHAARLLHVAHEEGAPVQDGAVGERPVRLAELTAGLLDARFEIQREASGYVLHGEREVVETARPLLGRSTQCVGRRRELTTLQAVLEECLEEPVARAVLVTGPPGIGKSRLRYEFERLAREAAPALEVWLARGDAVRTGTPFTALAPVLRRTAGIHANDPLPLRRQKLKARLARTVPATRLQGVAEFMGEMIGVSFADEESAVLANARLDPAVMADAMRRAWEDLVAAECEAHPLLFIVEDLQWADQLSVRYLDAALRTQQDRAFMVLGLGRPEVREAFPDLWSERGVQEIRLGPLTRRACEEFARHALGPGLDEALMERLMERSGGNPFFLEELIRAAGSGRGVALPGTVLAMVHARLEALAPEARRVLRAASIYGQTFWRAGLVALLGSGQEGRLPEWLSALTEREIITLQPTSRFATETEYTFRLAQAREAAYAMLTEVDRTLGHRIAAGWLERAGETSAVVLGEHYEQGGAPVRAVNWYLDAARQSLASDDLGGVLARTERALACGASGETRAQLCLLQAQAHQWRGENIDAARAGMEALRALPRDQLSWFVAAGTIALACGRLADSQPLVVLADALRTPPTAPTLRGARAVALALLLAETLHLGLLQLAQELLPLLDDAGRADDPTTVAHLLHARATQAGYAGDAGLQLELVEEAARRFETAGDLRNMCGLRVSVGQARLALGLQARAAGALREARAAASRLGLHHVTAKAEYYMADAMLRQESVDEARACVQRAVEAFTAQGNRRMLGLSHALLARVEVRAGDVSRALPSADMAVRVLEPVPGALAQALATQAEVWVAQGAPEPAFQAACRALDILHAWEGACDCEMFVRVAHLDALTLSGATGEYQTYLLRAHERLQAGAARVQNSSWRQSYLASVPENARIVALARALRGG